MYADIYITNWVDYSGCRSLTINQPSLDLDLNGQILHVQTDASITAGSGDFRFYDTDASSYDMDDVTLIVDGELTFTGDPDRQMILTNLNSENNNGSATYCTVTNCVNTGTDIDARGGTNIDGDGNSGWLFLSISSFVRAISIFKSHIFNSLLYNR